MFPRGTGPFVSVLIPSRGRINGLCDAVDSIFSLAKDKNALEFCFRIDVDDLETQEVVKKFTDVLPCSVIIAPRGKGYLETNRYVNQLCCVAQGDWLFGFNDDAIMVTQDWDQRLLEADPWSVPKWSGNEDICLLGPRVLEREISFEFPFIRRKTHEVMRRIAPVYAVDAYLYRVMATLNAAVVFPQVEISHGINELNDDTKKEGKLVADVDLMPALDRQINANFPTDVEIIRKYLATGL